MKLSLCMALALTWIAGCGSKGSGSGAPASGSGAAGTAAGQTTASAAPAPAADSFFAGDVPATVKMKATKTFAMDPGMLMIQGVEGWAGGQLPGYEYMSMSKDTTAMARVATSPGVAGSMGCKELETPAKMAPLRAKNLKEVVPAVLRKVGKNKFVAKEGMCTADGQKGPVDIHYLNILRSDHGNMWHYAVLVAFPKDAPQDLKNEAMAWARSLEYNGGNGYTMP